MSDRWLIARQDTGPSARGAYGRLGPLIARVLCTGAATSSDKSLPPMPFGICSAQIPIGAQRFDGELTEIAAERGLRRIDERQKDFGADVARAGPRRFAASDTSRGSRRVVK